MQLSPQEARHRAREARNKLRLDALAMKAALSPNALSGRAKSSLYAATDRALVASQRAIRANKTPIIGAAAGICLLFIAKPLIKAFKMSRSETKNGKES